MRVRLRRETTRERTMNAAEEAAKRDQADVEDLLKRDAEFQDFTRTAARMRIISPGTFSELAKFAKALNEWQGQ